MVWRPTLAASLFVIIALSGCSSDDAGTGEPALTVDDDVKVTATTGAIRGIVVDTLITPIAEAEVSIRGQDMTTTTNADGEFAFSNVEPGTHFLDITKAGYGPVQTSADVVAGEALPPIVQVQIEKVAGLEPRSFMRQWDGTIQCSVRYVVNAIAACSTVGLLGDDFAERYTDLGTPPTFVQSEMLWKNTQQLGESLKLEYTDDSSGKDNYRIHQGPSPLVINADNATLETKNFDDVGLLVRVFTGSYQDSGVSLTLQQSFTVYSSFYYNYAPPEDWRFHENSELYPVP